ncbi:non-ribosomal peptide synthetase [Cyclobacterium sp.]|uniref:non-ribosomal peptide synthetase n=1 Tax=Cyclobacterium sp. TaxID=1966343 RepID=UPI0019AE90A6|nr:non-ribosomal peptide synthetase [Cyclobacterium sp.]MBD3629798.1 amino acid adenylation domain-containing protein [Cyclobacterium sp.]
MSKSNNYNLTGWHPLPPQSTIARESQNKGNGKNKVQMKQDHVHESVVLYPDHQTIVDLFEQQAEKNPEALAVVDGERQITFGALNARANKLAYLLQERGVKSESLVPVLINRSLESVVGIVSILKAGGAYVPIDPSYPESRIQYILEDTEARVLLYSRDSAGKLPQKPGLHAIEIDGLPTTNLPEWNRETRPVPEQLAYVIYTSGSSGKPKGVMIEHRALLDHCFGIIEAAGFSKCRSFALMSPLVFDAGHSLLHSAFILGAGLHIISDEAVKNGNILASYFNNNEIDCVKVVPSLWLSYLRDHYLPLAKKVMLFGGEPFPLAIHKALHQAKYQGSVYNHYGPTEATIGKCIFKLDLAEKYEKIPIGRPFSNTQLYIVGENLNLLDEGETGELLIAGDGLARGYLNLPQLTSERFISNPFSETEKKCYRTGDLVRWSADAQLEYLGRTDNQIKVRGFRIEPGEIETELEKHESVRQAQVTAYTTENGQEHIVAYIIPNGALSPSKLTGFLKSSLPQHLVPTLWHSLDIFPLTINGKLDKKSLPDPVTQYKPSKNQLVALQPIEKKLLGIWGNLSGIKGISIRDNIFEMGGNSLLAMRLTAAIRQEWKKEISVKEVFYHPTIKSLARLVDKRQEHETIKLERIQNLQHNFPLSYGQEGLWFLHQLEGSEAYHLSQVFQIKGDLKPNKLENALKNLLVRHQILTSRIAINEDGTAEQVPGKLSKWRMTRENGEARYSGSSDPKVTEKIIRIIRKPFDFSSEGMFRASLITVSEGHHLLVLAMHHMVSDAWSMAIIKKELSEGYKQSLKKDAIKLPALQVQYADYTQWQRSLARQNAIKPGLEYWNKKLAGVSPLHLPLDFSRSRMEKQEGKTLRFSLDKDLYNSVKRIARERNATMFMTLLAIFKVLLYRYSGQNDICIGTAISGREQENLQPLVGYFVRTLPLRSTIHGNHSFTKVLEEVKNNALELFEHQETPFEKLVESLEIARIKGMHPLFQQMFVYQDALTQSLELEGCEVNQQHPDHGTSTFDLTFELRDCRSGLEGKVEFKSQLYTQHTISRFIRHYQQLVHEITHAPELPIDQLPLMDKAEKEQIILQFSKSPNTEKNRQIPVHSVLTMIANQRFAKPAATALEFGEEKISYQALEAKSEQMARYLRRKGVKTGDKVPVCLPRSEEMVISLLGILKAGAAYVPIDPAYPEVRIKLLAEAVHPSLVICQSVHLHFFEQATSLVLTDREMDQIYLESAGALSLQIDPELPAYVIFTSGSTGSPKGVSVSHQALATSTLSRITCYPEIGNSLLVPSFAFDSSVAVIFGTLAAGGTLLLCPSADLYRTDELSLHLNKTETLLCVPSFYRFLLEENLLANAPVKRVTVAGESLNESLVALHYNLLPHVDLYNEYGPTEATVWATVEKLDREDQKVTIGRPNAHSSIYILDNSGAPVPIGLQGEVFIGGEGVAQGYFNQPKLTSTRFLPDPFSKKPGARMYRSGDLAKWLPDGKISFSGRRDQQVKINGFRIELEEIEAALNGLAEVKVAAVTLSKTQNGTARLLAHVVAEKSLSLLSDPVKKEHVSGSLEKVVPRYMVPGNWRFLSALPLTANKKIDRNKLSEMGLPPKIKESRPPADPVELALCGIWKRILNMDEVSTTTDFFVAGGHSILGIKLLAAVRREMNAAIGLGDLFSAPTISGMAEIIRSNGQQKALPPIKTTEAKQIGEVPLSYSQESLWVIDLLEGSDQYHIPLVLRLKGAIDPVALEKALKQMLLRHEVLRTVIRQKEGKPYQQVMDPGNWKLAKSSPIPYEDLHAQIQSMNTAPFDLSRDYMLRAGLLTAGPMEAVLVITFHHIAFDGWSLPLFLEELADFYKAACKGEKCVLSPPVQYRDFALWQRKYLTEKTLQPQLEYWTSKLRGITPLMNREGEYSGQNTDNAGTELSFVLPENLKNRLQQMSNQQGVTLYMTLLAAFKVWLHRFFERETLCVGTPTSGRQHPDLEKALGYFINPLPIRSFIRKGMKFTDFLDQVKTNCMEAFENQDLPFEKIVAATNTERIIGQNPLFQVMCSLQEDSPVAHEAYHWGDQLELTALDSLQIKAKYDLSLIFTTTGQALKGKITCKTNKFGEDQPGQFVTEYRQILERISGDPEQNIGSLILPEANPQLSESAALPPFLSSDFIPVHKQISQAAERDPEKIAVVCNEQALSYHDLNQSANQLAHFLIEKGMGPGKVVGILMDRSIEMIIAILGTLKTGAAYLPVDTGLPEKRILYMLQDSCQLTISGKPFRKGVGLKGKLLEWDTFTAAKEHLPLSEPGLQTRAEDSAYIIYTSGSTGKPKGVVISHANLHHFLTAVSDSPGIHRDDRFLAVSSVSFDIAILETLLPYVYGAQCYVLDERQRKDPREVLLAFEKFEITTVFATPTHWKMLLEIGWEKRFENLRIISGGEALSLELAQKLLLRCKTLWNIYGPTETTVFSTIKEINASDKEISVGKPIANTKVYILNEHGLPVPEDQEGEVYISGAGVAKGYLNQPELSRKRFLKDPFDASGKHTMYKTGDLGKSLAEGEYAVLGRIDQQVKIRGHRVELEEIERVLKNEAKLKEVTVIYLQPEAGNGMLFGFINGTTETFAHNKWQQVLGLNVMEVSETVSSSWKKKLGAHLPAYMVPDRYWYLQKFPLTSSGKLDRRQLAEIAEIGLETNPHIDPESPGDPMDSAIANTWQKVLNLPRVNPTDNFFEIGGHSLAAVQVMAALESRFAIKLPLALFFKHPVLKDLSMAMQSQVTENQHWESLVPIKPEGSKTPLFMVHGAGLHVMPFYELTKKMDPDQPIFGLQAKGLDGKEQPLESIEAMAAHYIAEIESKAHQGPYILAGYSLGGIIAFEMAKQWRRSGKKIEALILLDTYVFPSDPVSFFDRLAFKFQKVWFDCSLLAHHPKLLLKKKKASWERKKSVLRSIFKKSENDGLSPLEQTLKDLKRRHREAMYRYQPAYYDGEVHLLRAKIPTNYFHDLRYLGWKPLVKKLTIHEVEGTHTELFSPENRKHLADTIQLILDRKT